MSSNVIDTHNQVRQGELKYEKHWKGCDPWMRLCTTILIGENVTDAWMMTRSCIGSNHKCKTMTSIIFAAKVAMDLLRIPFSEEVQRGVDIPYSIPFNIGSNVGDFAALVSPLTQNSIASDSIFSFSGMANSLETDEDEVLMLTLLQDHQTVCIPYGAPSVPESFRCQHPKATLSTNDTGKPNARPRRHVCCDPLCGRQTQYHCVHCNKSFCNDSGKINRHCFYNHICEAYAISIHKNAHLQRNFNAVLWQWQQRRKPTMPKAK